MTINYETRPILCLSHSEQYHLPAGRLHVDTSDILVFKFVLVFISFISNDFYFYIITVFSNKSISVFISFASNHFYIYFIIVL